MKFLNAIISPIDKITPVRDIKIPITGRIHLFGVFFNSYIEDIRSNGDIIRITRNPHGEVKLIDSILVPVNKRTNPIISNENRVMNILDILD